MNLRALLYQWLRGFREAGKATFRTVDAMHGIQALAARTLEQKERGMISYELSVLVDCLMLRRTKERGQVFEFTPLFTGEVAKAVVEEVNNRVMQEKKLPPPPEAIPLMTAVITTAQNLLKRGLLETIRESSYQEAVSNLLDFPRWVWSTKGSKWPARWQWTLAELAELGYIVRRPRSIKLNVGLLADAQAFTSTESFAADIRRRCASRTEFRADIRRTKAARGPTLLRVAGQS